MVPRFFPITEKSLCSSLTIIVFVDEVCQPDKCILIVYTVSFGCIWDWFSKSDSEVCITRACIHVLYNTKTDEIGNTIYNFSILIFELIIKFVLEMARPAYDDSSATIAPYNFPVPVSNSMFDVFCPVN